MSILQHFTAEQLLRAMSPIDQVIDAILRERDSDINDGDTNADNRCDKFDVECQHHFVCVVRSVLGNGNSRNNLAAWSSKEEKQEENENQCNRNKKKSTEKIVYTPTRRYMNKLILRFVSRIERENSISIDVEDEDLAILLAEHLDRGGRVNFGMKRRLGVGVDDMPDPTESCYQSFHVPSSFRCLDDVSSPATTSAAPSTLLGIRVYPQHNDVGVSRIWEAGCCLAEYLLEYPSYVKDKRVVELGAGVGLTGLVAAGSCGAIAVHMTDYTEDCLENLDYNVKLNDRWLMETRQHYNENDEVFEGVTTVRCVS